MERYRRSSASSLLRGAKSQHCDKWFKLLFPKFLDCWKFKAIADDKINVTKKQKFLLGWVENVVGKGEDADYQSLFHTMLSKAPFSGCQKSVGWLY